ncbi:cysteine/serine-rich nuclear protein 3-like [Gouania willdenowi]|uniref:Cysteine/serine-rich nuclear protein 3-like n=1 Tax=Gouania willdenowi TaxID=441366 RepID=A0A8C5HXB1_GOUWI|nr:cysteine/serine-rich nuclear protein 3-like [Gouania willdenowi]
MLFNHSSQTMRGVVKRKFAEVDENPSCSSSSSPSSFSSEWDSEDDYNVSQDQDLTPHNPSPPSLPSQSILKRSKVTDGGRRVSFNQVTVFSFPRSQGFTSVPSHGGATLGMAQRHNSVRKYTVDEHALEQRRRRKERLREKMRAEKLKEFKQMTLTTENVTQLEAEELIAEDGEISLSDSEVDGEVSLQPFSYKQRQALLQASGVKLIDREEKRQLHALRLSREACGCDCQGFCEPETCACSLAGIKCQVDRFTFPCGCTKDSCGNTEGRIEFESHRVQTHYIHTVVRLGLEKRLNDERLNLVDLHTELPAELQDYEHVKEQHHPEQSIQEKRCPFAFALEEEDIALTVSTTPTFHFMPEHVGMEEDSCSSGMTDSSSSDSDTGGGFSWSLSEEVDEGFTHAIRSTGLENSNYSLCERLKTTGEPVMSGTDTTGPCPANRSDYLDENASLARHLFDDSLEDLSSAPSLDRYLDLTLSSHSDLEFFSSDFPCASLHSSFKAHRHSDGFQHLQMFSSTHLPTLCESSTHLLESLIGLNDSTMEQIYSVNNIQILQPS